MLNFSKFMIIVSASILPVLFSACAKEIQKEFFREELFSLSYGTFENEINMFNLNSSYTRPDTQIFMQDGVLYISNSGGGKILKMSAFGDLLSIHYNPLENPEPAFLKKNENGEIIQGLITAIEYRFNRVGLIAVTKSKNIFAVDTLSEDRMEFEHQENLALRDLILHFDENGNFINFIGQEGVGGTPFPLLEGLYTNTAEDVIAVCRTGKGVKVYWYNQRGELLYKIPIFFNSLPADSTISNKRFSAVDKIVPDFNKERLYVKVDYYIEETDPATGVSAGISYDKSCLYFLEIKTGKYEKKVDIAPCVIEDTEAGKNIKYKKVYELAGVTEAGLCYLFTPQDYGYALRIVDLNSQTIYKAVLNVPLEERVYNTFHLSSTGILSALLARNDKALFVWWKTNLKGFSSLSN